MKRIRSETTSCELCGVVTFSKMPSGRRARRCRGQDGPRIALAASKSPEACRAGRSRGVTPPRLGTLGFFRGSSMISLDLGFLDACIAEDLT